MIIDGRGVAAATTGGGDEGDGDRPDTEAEWSVDPHRIPSHGELPGRIGSRVLTTRHLSRENRHLVRMPSRWWKDVSSP
ncbi:hypothetical protein ACW9HK_28865 [Nocardia gipuzkoensis]